MTLLGLPSFLLQSELTELGYLGYLWIAVTLQGVIFSWVGLGIGMVCIIGYAVRDLALVRWINRDWVRLAALALLVIFLCFVGRNIIAYRSAALVPAIKDGSAAMFPLFEEEDRLGYRNLLYELISLGGLLTVAGLIWITAGARFSRTVPPLRRLVQLVIAMLGLVIFLDWPMVFGRLQIPYERPVIVVSGPPTAEGMALNIRSQYWTIVSREPDATRDLHHSLRLWQLDIRGDREWKVVRYQNLFDYVRGSSAPKL
jgi:hypothetical protein